MKFLIITLLISFEISAQFSLIQQNSSWKYFDQGTTGNSNWKDLSFDDSAWNSGTAELGYGDGDEATVVSYGSNSNSKYITTYFRKTINVTNVAQYAYLALNLMRDDGAVIYINGVEVWRSNMPSGTIGYSTLASGTIAWPTEDDWHSTQISAGYLQEGDNIIAVEIHQDDVSSSDISFNFSMVAHDNLVASIDRGPYLQIATQNSIIIRWRTNVACDSKVKYGISPAQLNGTFSNLQFTNDHEALITGLQPNTTYYYSILNGNNSLAQGSNFYFKTLPMQGSTSEYKFIALGDAGTGTQEQKDVKTAILNHGGNHYDGILLLGDNAYQSGFDDDYQDNFFNNIYNEIMENTVIWPAPGNHDYNNHIPFSPSPAYYDIFNCPTTAQAGGLASGTEKYYSFNYGNIHFISLDSYDESRSSSAPMATWLTQDLQLNTQPWIIAYWHHPPYTKGSHDSDDNFLDSELGEIRENIVPILENYKVDLVLNGHSHSYERSNFINGHYGESQTFNNSHIQLPGSGDYPDDCPYAKGQVNGESINGAVYTVLGCSGKTSSVAGSWPHAIMNKYTNEKIGAMFITVNNNRLDAEFLTKEGTIYDHFTILKRESETHTVNVCINEQVALSPVWDSEMSIWQPGNDTSNVFSIQALSNATISVTDELGCFTDQYLINVLQNDSCGYLILDKISMVDFEINSISTTEMVLTVATIYDNQELGIYNLEGGLIQQLKLKSGKQEYPVQLKTNEIYFLKTANNQTTHKFTIYE